MAGPLLAARHDPDQALERVVEPPRDAPDLGADVVDQPDSLIGDRLADLGCLSDPLDELLCLVRGEDPLPDAIDHLAVYDLDDRPLDRGALEHLGDGTLRSGALERANDRDLSGLLERPVDSRRLGGARRSADPGARAGADHAREQRLRWIFRVDRGLRGLRHDGHDTGGGGRRWGAPCRDPSLTYLGTPRCLAAWEAGEWASAATFSAKPGAWRKSPA